MMEIIRIEELPQSYVDEVRKLGATAVNVDNVPVLFVKVDQGQRFRGCHVYDRQMNRNLIVISSDLTGEELHQTLLHEAWHCCNGDGQSDEPEEQIEQRCCKMTGT